MKRYTRILAITIILFSAVFILIRCGGSGGDNGNNPVEPTTSAPSGLEIPTSASSDQIVKHTAYTLQYNETHEQPDWVAYFMTQSRLSGGVSRTDDYREDPSVTTGSAQLDDYKYTGYDRGHIAPAGDFTWSQTAMTESFYLSNMCPQVHAFNAGIWEDLESQVRSWANVAGDTLFITAGPILRNGLQTIGARNKLSVPEYFFKTILRKSATGYQAIAFYMKHENSAKPLADFAITVDSLEKITNIDFFGKLPSSIQSAVESTVDLSKWSNIMYKSGSSVRKTASK